jgi:lipid II:glycine glycyltransferase (peptidoglycan interpeptide bridge formation enzyme)
MAPTYGTSRCCRRTFREAATLAGAWACWRLQIDCFMNAPVWQVEVDSSTPSGWSEMLDLFNDANIYQTWSYGSVRWGAKNLSHLAVKRDGEVVGMAQLRIIRPTWFNFGMAYLRWGPVCERRGMPLDSEVLNYLSRALEEEYVRKRRLLLRVLPNAFAGSMRADLFQAAFQKFKPKPVTEPEAYRTFLLDLTLPMDELRGRLDKKWRNQLSRAEKNSLRVVAGSGIEEFRTFCRLYAQMKERKGFESTVNVEEFGRMQEALDGAHRLRILICEDGGEPVAGLVATAIGESAIYLLGATSDSGLNSKGAYLLQWTLIQELRERGFKWYDLGGINPEGNPGVYHFKRGLSGVDVTHVHPLVACNSALSSALVNIGLAMHRSLRAGHRRSAGRPAAQIVIRQKLLGPPSGEWRQS